MKRTIVANQIEQKQMIEIKLIGQKPYYKVFCKGVLVHDGWDRQVAYNFFSWN